MQQVIALLHTDSHCHYVLWWKHGVRFRLQIGDLNLTLTLTLTLPDLNLSVFPSIPCLVSGRRSEPIIIPGERGQAWGPLAFVQLCPMGVTPLHVSWRWNIDYFKPKKSRNSKGRRIWKR